MIETLPSYSVEIQVSILKYTKESKMVAKSGRYLVVILMQLVSLPIVRTSPKPETTLDFQNPVIWNDLADIDIFRVDDTYYYSASSMHFSPGAPLLHSKDLVNWEYLGFSVPSLNFNSPAYSLQDGLRAYARGVWASTLRYRQTNKLWYWIGCVDFNATYFYTSTTPGGPYEQAAALPGTCLYDCGLLIDDDDSGFDLSNLRHGANLVSSNVCHSRKYGTESSPAHTRRSGHRQNSVRLQRVQLH